MRTTDIKVGDKVRLSEEAVEAGYSWTRPFISSIGVVTSIDPEDNLQDVFWFTDDCEVDLRYSYPAIYLVVLGPIDGDVEHIVDDFVLSQILE
jgi:hypothetical protein